MFNQFTWQQFTITLGLIVLAYYLIVILLFFRDTLFRILRGQEKPFKNDDSPDSGSDDLHSRFADRLDEQDHLHDHTDSLNRNELMVGTVADLLDEIKALAHIIRTNESSKEEAESFYRMLLSRYEQLINTPYQQSINEAIQKLLTEDMLLNTTLSEIKTWWPSLNNKITNQ